VGETMKEEIKSSGNLFVKILGDGVTKLTEIFEKSGIKPKDFIYSEKLGKIDLYNEDTIIGGSSDSLKNISSVKSEIPQVSLPTIPTIPTTTTTPTKETIGNVEHKGEIKIVVDVQAPSGVDVASLNRMFSDPIFLMEMSEKLKKVSTNSVYF
jgi:hypothetical protein